jgi:UDP-3-O-[3-hydroxymyristoyl] glucosamine N-acyltransferase
LFTEVNKPALMVANPRLAFAQLLDLFKPETVFEPDIHPSAVIGGNFNGKDLEIGPFVSIGTGVTIGKGSVIYAGVVIGDRVIIGAGCRIEGNVVIQNDCVIGNNVRIHAGSGRINLFELTG